MPGDPRHLDAQPAPAGHDPGLKTRIQGTYRRYQRFTPAFTFLGGCTFDILTLERIDKLTPMIQLGSYLVIVGASLAVEAITEHHPITVPRWLQKPWHYREEAVHFFLGTLLSAFTIFYFKSASLLSSLLFFLFIAGLLVANEFSALRRLGLVVRTSLFAVCLTSYLACVTPVWWGRIGLAPFLTAIASSALLFAGLFYIVRRKVDHWPMLRNRFAVPFASTLMAFVVFYALHLIPPVPLSLTHIGIYHSVERVKGGYQVTWTRPKWKVWQHGDQTFINRPGDRLYCFFSIFSPGGFHDAVKVRWRYKDGQHGWTDSDAIPVHISGGREEGWRGFTYKTAFKPGEWQVRIETSDEREIGRLNLSVETPEPDAPLEVHTEVL